MKELSICLTHINRREQLLNTLRSIEKQANAKELTEIIIVDDVSEVPLKLSDFKKIDLDIKLISIQTNHKWWYNPCVAFNTAFNFVHAKRVIIQNAECLHKTGIIDYTIKNLKPNEYIAMSALSLSEVASKKINRKTKMSDISLEGAEWYCHSRYRPKAYNFCAALMTEDLRAIGGFDLRFSEGICYEDDIFLSDLRKSGVKIRIEDSQVVYHQWHEKIWENLKDEQSLLKKNKALGLKLG